VLDGCVIYKRSLYVYFDYSYTILSQEQHNLMVFRRKLHIIP
jgi:hypothetical protein